MLQQLTKRKMKKPNLLAPILMIFLLCLIFTSTLLVQGMALVADDADDTRDVKVETTTNKATIESELKTDDEKNEFKIAASTSAEGLEFKLEYKDDPESAIADLEFKVNVYELIEYVDGNADGVYNVSVDDEIQTVPLNDFQPINSSTGNDDYGTPFHIITINTTDGVFTCQIYAAGKFTTINENVVKPEEIKIDFGIHGFDYDDDGSDLALNISLESPGTNTVTDTGATDEVQVTVSLDGFAGFFSWNTDVAVTNEDLETTDSVVKYSLYDEDVGDGTDLKIYLNYPRGIDIIHDPKIGIAESIPSEIISNLLAILELSKEGYLGSVAVFTLLVMSGVILYRRKRK